MLKQFSPSRLNVNLHVVFHHALMKRLKSASEFGIAPQMLSAYSKAILAEQDTVRKTFGSALTPELHQLDQKRNHCYRHVRNVLLNLQYSSRPELQALAPIAQEKITDVFGSDIPEMGMHEKSALMRGFTLDIRQFFTSEQIATLDLTAELAALDRTNDEFEARYLDRVNEYASYEVGEAERLRQASDDIYAQLCAVINYKANIAQYGTAIDKEHAPKAQEAESALNVLITTFNALIK